MCYASAAAAVWWCHCGTHIAAFISSGGQCGTIGVFESDLMIVCTSHTHRHGYMEVDCELHACANNGAPLWLCLKNADGN